MNDQIPPKIDIKDLYIPAIIIVIFLLILGYVTLNLFANVLDKDAKLADSNTLIFTLYNDSNVLVNTLTNISAQLASVTNSYNESQQQLGAMTNERNALTAQNTQYVGQLQADAAQFLVFANDMNLLANDKNIVINDLNSRGRRLYSAFNNCYLAIKAGIDGNIILGSLDNNLILSRCVTVFDTNSGDFNYFK